jgi:Tfp pilus assembly protein PilZ
MAQSERRSSGMLRVPFIRRCSLEWEGGADPTSAFTVNINVLGAYVAFDDMPHLGQPVRFRVRLPETERELSIDGVVAWVNPRQQHPVHSLPPGFGISFRALSDDNRRAIEGVVDEYVARHPAR